MGSLNEMFFFNNAKETLEDNLRVIDKLGGVETCNHYPWGWTNAGNTPFRRWKRETYRGGTTDPCIVSWPGGIRACGEMRTQYGHIIDFVPTVLEALGMEAPQDIRGVTQAPIDGVSFAHTFNDASAPEQSPHPVLRDDRSPLDLPRRLAGGLPVAGAEFTEAAEKGRQFGSPIPGTVLADIEAPTGNCTTSTRTGPNPQRWPRTIATSWSRWSDGGGLKAEQVPGPAASMAAPWTAWTWNARP